MNLRKPERLGLRLGIALICFVYGCSTQGQTIYTDTIDHYSFALEAEWVEIPKSVIDEFVGLVLDQTNGMRIEYSAGFQLNDRSYFEYPYILIQEHHVDLNSSLYSEIERMFTQDHFPSRIRDAASDYPEFIDIDTVDDSYIDIDRNVVITKLSSDVANVGSVNAIIAMFLGRNQITQLNFYWESIDQNQWVPVFNRTIESFHYHDGYDYDPTMSNSSPPRLLDMFESMFRRGFIGGASGLFFGLFAVLFALGWRRLKTLNGQKN